MRVVVALQLRLARRRHRSGRRRRKNEKVGVADLRLEAVNGVAHDRRELEPADDGFRHLLPQDQPSLRRGVARFRVAVVAQDRVEAAAIEARAGGIEEGGIALDDAHDLVIADGEAELRRLLLEQRVGEQAREHLAVDAGSPGLVAGDAALLLLLQALQLGLEGVAILVDRDLAGAHAGDLAGVVTVEAVAYAPDREGADDEDEHHAQDRTPEEVLGERAHLREHGGSVAFAEGRGACRGAMWCLNRRSLATFAQRGPRC